MNHLLNIALIASTLTCSVLLEVGCWSKYLKRVLERPFMIAMGIWTILGVVKCLVWLIDGAIHIG